jgi:hypothetical protein
LLACPKKKEKINFDYRDLAMTMCDGTTEATLHNAPSSGGQWPYYRSLQYRLILVTPNGHNAYSAEVNIESDQTLFVLLFVLPLWSRLCQVVYRCSLQVCTSLRWFSLPLYSSVKKNHCIIAHNSLNHHPNIIGAMAQW